MTLRDILEGREPWPTSPPPTPGNVGWLTGEQEREESVGGSELLSPTERGDPELAEVTDMSWAVEALPGLAMEELESESSSSSCLFLWTSSIMASLSLARLPSRLDMLVVVVSSAKKLLNSLAKVESSSSARVESLARLVALEGRDLVSLIVTQTLNL